MGFLLAVFILLSVFYRRLTGFVLSGMRKGGMRSDGLKALMVKVFVFLDTIGFCLFRVKWGCSCKKESFLGGAKIGAASAGFIHTRLL